MSATHSPSAHSTMGETADLHEDDRDEREILSKEELSSLFYAIGFVILLVGCVVTQLLF